MDAGGKATAVWFIVTFVKPAKSPNPSENAATFKSAASPRKWTQTMVQLYFYISAALKVVLRALPPYAHPQMTRHFRVVVSPVEEKKKCNRCVTRKNVQPADRWVVEEWSPCSKTCGKLGYQSRVVQCMQALHNGTNRPIHSKHCTEDRPEMRRACNHTVCPAQWRTGAWSQVSEEEGPPAPAVLKPNHNKLV